MNHLAGFNSQVKSTPCNGCRARGGEPTFLYTFDPWSHGGEWIAVAVPSLLKPGTFCPEPALWSRAAKVESGKGNNFLLCLYSSFPSTFLWETPILTLNPILFPTTYQCPFCLLLLYELRSSNSHQYYQHSAEWWTGLWCIPGRKSFRRWHEIQQQPSYRPLLHKASVSKIMLTEVHSNLATWRDQIPQTFLLALNESKNKACTQTTREAKYAQDLTLSINGVQKQN